MKYYGIIIKSILESEGHRILFRVGSIALQRIRTRSRKRRVLDDEARHVNFSAAMPETTVDGDYCLLIRLTESFNVGKRQISSRLIPCKSFGRFHR